MPQAVPDAKFGKLVDILRQHEKIAVAFSGGVDSTLTVHAAITALGAGKVIALYALSTLNSGSTIAGARATFAGNFSSRAVIKELPVDPLLWPEFVMNTEDRCYLCKKRMYTVFNKAMVAEGCSVLVDGTNADDLLEKRPGLRAIRELQVKTPLAEVELTKVEIRFLACKEGMTNFDLPSNSCLATRIMPGKPITEKDLRLIETAEKILHDRGFLGCRVRPRDTYFMIEVQEKDIARFVEKANREAVQESLGTLQKGPIMLNLTGK